MTSESHNPSTRRLRAGELGIHIGRMTPGKYNAITDVPGVKVGHCTLISGEWPPVDGKKPVRTGLTVVIPCENIPQDALFAGYHVLNGCGDMTGLQWVDESGQLTSVIGLTNTFSVGVVRDALIQYHAALGLPVVAETYDGFLSDIQGMHVQAEHVKMALDSASSGPVAEGCVGGGTGMICHGFKGGIGSASRVLPAEAGNWTVGVLVQANHGRRARLRIAGVPVGEAIPNTEVPEPSVPMWTSTLTTSSIIAVIATDAPLLPGQCRRLAQRAALGIGRTGGLGENLSGDIFIAFSTANRGLNDQCEPGTALSIRMLPNNCMNPLFEAVVDGVEESILNALCAATDTAGINGLTAYALPLDRLQAVMQQNGR